MQHHIICPKTGGLFFLSDFNNANYEGLLSSSALYKILYNTGKAVKVLIDGASNHIKNGEILFCKPLNTIQVYNAHNDLKVVAYNKDFYKLTNAEEEATFYWFWYFGVKHPHCFSLSKVEKGYFKMMYDCMEHEFKHSNGCIETERDILKRIMAVSIARIEHHPHSPLLGETQLNFIKRFSRLIEDHFRKKTSLRDVSNLFEKRRPTIRQFFKKYFSQRTKERVKEKVRSTSWSAVEQIETEIELQYNSRLNPIPNQKSQIN